MINFLFGLIFGTLIGIVGAFFAWILGMVVIEDSPEAKEILTDLINKA